MKVLALTLLLNLALMGQYVTLILTWSVITHSSADDLYIYMILHTLISPCLGLGLLLGARGNQDQIMVAIGFSSFSSSWLPSGWRSAWPVRCQLLAGPIPSTCIDHLEGRGSSK
jgi:hypothetical protein